MTGTERKVFQKYYPPDFDPRKIPRAKQPRNRQFVQRVMSPFNMQCNTCGEYIYKGKKFNMRRETAEGEEYLGLRIFRFYFRCPNCLAEITFKTDLENTDYANEHGATRLFEAEKLLRKKVEEEEKKEEEEKSDPMKMLEKRTKMSRAEMEALGNLEELREKNRRYSGLDYEGMLIQYRDKEAEALRKQEQQDEAYVQSLFGCIKKEEEDPGGGPLIKRIHDSDSDSDLPSSSSSVSAPAKEVEKAVVSTQKQKLKNLVVPKKKAREEPEAPGGGLGALGAYQGISSSDSD